MSWSIRGECFENCNCEVLCRYVKAVPIEHTSSNGHKRVSVPTR